MTGVEIKVEQTRITPAIATELLRRNTHNRTVSPPRVRQYAADIAKGNWRFNGEAIKIALTGQILDGQHRLLAVLEADGSIETLLITGLEPETQETMDQGRARTLADVLKLRGEGDYHVLAAAVRNVCLYERDGVPFKQPYVQAPTVHEATRTLDRNPQIRDSVKRAAQLRRSSLLPSSAVATLHYLFSSVDTTDADDFFTRLLRGEGLTRQSPVYVLRDRLLVDLRERALTPKIKLAFVIRSWNAYRLGEPMTRLVWTPGGANPDRFPRIGGLARPGAGARDEDRDDPEPAHDEAPDVERPLEVTLADELEAAEPEGNTTVVPMSRRTRKLLDDEQRLRGQLTRLLAREWPLTAETAARKLVVNVRDVGECMGAMRRDGLLERGPGGGYQLVDRAATAGTAGGGS